MLWSEEAEEMSEESDVTSAAIPAGFRTDGVTFASKIYVGYASTPNQSQT